ncbi:hypothetical protein OIU84_016295 [Salix udensis]|uniref:Uncharacterized protein n=1 Tax=Salix udensis TaxID=889485 RepID=A0AAD6NPJ8_9ROSI|nr:hypothetical protein OIU84_016295 [Salix udensis]
MCVQESNAPTQKQFHAQLAASFPTLFVGLTASPTLVVVMTLSATALMSSRKGSARPRHYSAPLSIRYPCPPHALPQLSSKIL